MGLHSSPLLLSHGQRQGRNGQRKAHIQRELGASPLHNPGIVRNRTKVFGVRKNARVVQEIQREFGSFDAYLWGFADGIQVDGKWESIDDMPTESDISRAMSTDMKRRGMSYVGPVITYSFMQAIGIVNDHLKGCSYR